MKPVPLFCKVIEIIRTTDGNAAIVFSKDKVETMDIAIKVLKSLEGKDVHMIIQPYKRVEHIE
jgi:hypothetical protein